MILIFLKSELFCKLNELRNESVLRFLNFPSSTHLLIQLLLVLLLLIIVKMTKSLDSYIQKLTLKL